MSGTRAKAHQVLLVEDDPGVQRVVESHLKKGRYEVRTAASAEEVLHDLRDGSLDYDLALVDIHLPGMSGLELARLLLTTRPLSSVVIVTGDSDEAVAREALSDGVSGYLLKPFQLFELEAAVQQAVAMRELVETTETLARAQSQGLEDWGESGGLLPRSWLHVGDEKSGAGSGHGARVVSVAGLLGKKLGDDILDARARELLRTAARTHEIGRITGASGRGQVARTSSQLLDDLGFDSGVSELVRQAVEPWSPGLPVGARLLTIADMMDHIAVEVSRTGVESDEAVAAAIAQLDRGAGEEYDPEFVALLQRERDQIESMWILQRQVADS